MPPAVTDVDLRGLRLAGAAMLPIALVRPALPVEVAPPCPLRTLTGIPCPLCGMTRGVTAAVHGHLAESLRLNPGAIAAIAVAVVLLACFRARRVTVPVWAVVAVLGVLWSYQLFKYATGRPL